MKVSMGLVVMVAAVMCVSAVAAQPQTVTIALIGDSTVSDDSGWGKAFAGRFNDKAKILNFAESGRSAKSWYDENHLSRVLQARPDYVLIQFGHNDQPGKGVTRETNPATTYRDYLKIYVDEFDNVGARPVIISPVTRRIFDENGKITSTLTPWAEAAKVVAAELKVPFIDLHASSMNYHNKIGPEASMTFNPREGDVTHFNRNGAEAMTDLILQDIMSIDNKFAEYLK